MRELVKRWRERAAKAERWDGEGSEINRCADELERELEALPETALREVKRFGQHPLCICAECVEFRRALAGAADLPAQECGQCGGTGVVSVYVGNVGGSVACDKCRRPPWASQGASS